MALHHDWMMGEAGEAALKDTASHKEAEEAEEAEEAGEANIFQ